MSSDQLQHIICHRCKRPGHFAKEDKVQRMPPWKYLGLQIAAKTIVPQKLEIECNPKTLADLHSLCGSFYWEGRNSPKRLTKEMFEHLLQSNASLQLSLDSYRGQISVHAPSHKLLNEEFHLIPREKRSRRPLKALTVFTDASGASHKSVMTWRNPQTQRWEADVEFVEGSPQVAELAAVVRAFEKFSEPINLVTDSAYVAGVVSRAEQAVLKEIDNEHLFRLLSKLIYLISHREHLFYVMHVRSHTDLPGEIAEGNRQADSLAAPVEKACLPDIFQQAKLSHQQYHQNVPGLIRQFQLTRSQARAIVATCPNCQVQAMPSMEKAYLTLNPVMNPIQVVILLLLNSLATAWIIPQPCQNVWVTLAQTLPQENICLSTASTENPMSTCLVGIPLWAGILSWLLGGPCTIGRLSVLTPNQTLISEWTHKNKSANKIQKRSADQLDPNCNSEIFHWAKSKRVAVSLFLLWVAAAKALGELSHLECWVVKQANLTSTAISSLLEDEEITRQATLQNRAAIDYILLLHGHECQEFEGLCCLNLTSKAPNIHAAIRSTNSLIGQVKQESEDWIKELCKGWGLTGWWTSIVKTILLFLVILFLVTIAFGILPCLIFKAINSLIPSTSEVNHIELANLKQKQTPKDHSEMRGSYRVTVMRMPLTLLKLFDIKAWKMGQPPENVWVTLAKTLQQDNLCLSMGSVSSPLSLCLVGIPFKINEPSPLHPFAGNWPALPTTEKGPAREAWEQWVKLIPKATTDAHKENPVANSESQELDLLVSAKASYCFNFYFQNAASSYKNQKADNNVLERDLIVALGIKITPCEGKLKIYSLTEEDNFEITDTVWYTGETGKLNVQPISIEIQNPEIPIRVKQYPISLEGWKGLKPVVENSVHQGVLESCVSPHNTPILPVKKPDGSYRLVQDLRAVNQRTITRFPGVAKPDTS
ncbi:hypothetical protein DUI87_20847 [Hirundo rustica rustica]|uniref:Uncharacterized protein n=1 Tax=Hirundo rustica rustica TaxID=333673 RepID=A0A3M0JTK3_HIRRU|nr:hypothetical protein DUI87_20847 [Hirundo rustica rustica]